MGTEVEGFEVPFGFGGRHADVPVWYQRLTFALWTILWTVLIEFGLLGLLLWRLVWMQDH
jgi:hypothetical protein